MRLSIVEAAQRDLGGLSEDQRAVVLLRLLDIPGAFRDPARHTGAGLRKLHPAGIWEVRCGLDLRLLLELRKDEAVLLKVGTHDDVRRYLRGI